MGGGWVGMVHNKATLWPLTHWGFSHGPSVAIFSSMISFAVIYFFVFGSGKFIRSTYISNVILVDPSFVDIN